MEIDETLLTKAFQKEPVIILISQSGGGKGTHSKNIINMYNKLYPGMPWLFSETGGLLREGLETFSPHIRNHLIEHQNGGYLQPYSLAVYVWMKNYLLNYYGGPIIVDGSPRSEKEAVILSDFYRNLAGKEIIVLHLEVSDTEAERRMIARNDLLIKQGHQPRADTSTAEARATKLKFFHTHVKPALKTMNTLGIPICTIDSERYRCGQ